MLRNDYIPTYIVDWQESVLSRYDPTGGLPSSPSEGDRYISTATANGWTINNIYEYQGTSWIETIANEGMITWVEDEDLYYIYDGSAWNVFGATVAHNSLNGLQGGNTTERYHMNLTQHDTLTDGSNADALHSHLNTDYQQVVTAAKAGGDYTVIQNAINSITDASASKLYVVHIYPGVYTENIIGKDYVDLKGISVEGVVEISNTSGTIYTIPNFRGSCTNIEFTLTTALSTEFLVKIPNTRSTIDDSCFCDCIFNFNKSGDTDGVMFDADGSGTFEIRLWHSTFNYNQTGDNVNSRENTLFNVYGTAVLDFRNCVINADLVDLDDNLIVLQDSSTSSKDYLLSNTEINITTASGYTGTAKAFRFNGSTLNRMVHGCHIHIGGTGGTGSGICYDFDTTSGGGEIESTHSMVEVIGYSTNYFGDIALGDTLTSYFDQVNAADGVIGVGTYEFVNSPSAGNIQISGSYLNMFDETYSIAPRGGDYQTIQAALDAKPDAGALFIVHAGTYTNDTINFTANNQAVVGAGPLEIQQVTNTSTIVDFGAFTGCFVQRMHLNMTTTTVSDCVTGSGSCEIYDCKNEVNASGTIAGSPTNINTTGTMHIHRGYMEYNSTAVSGGQVKRMINLGAGADVKVERVKIDMVSSGAVLGTTFAYGTSTGVIEIARSDFDISDSNATVTAGIYLGGSGSQLLSGNNINCVNDNNTSYGYYLTTGTTMSVRSLFNSMSITSSGGNARPYFVDTNVTLTSIYDTIVAAQASSGAGTLIYSGSLADGDLDASNDVNALNDLTVGNDATITGITTSASFVDTSGDGLEIPTPADLASNTMVKTIISASDYGIDYYIPAASQGRLNFVGAGTTYGYIEINGANAGDFLFQDSTATNGIVWDASLASLTVSDSTNVITVNGTNGYYTTTNGSTTYDYTPDNGVRVPTNFPAFVSDAIPVAGLWFSSGGIGSRYVFRNTSGNESFNLMAAGNGGLVVGTTYSNVTAPPAGGIICSGSVGVGIDTPTAKLHVDQSSTTAAIPVLYLDQADVSEEMIEFNTTIGVGNAIEAVGAKVLTTTHFVKVTLPGGLTRYFEVGTIA